MTVSPSATATLRPLPLPGRRRWQPVDALTSPVEYTQGSLALSYPLPAGPTAHPQTTALVVVPHGSSAAAGGGVEAWAAAFVQAVVEVVACDRPVTQLIRWTSRPVYADIAERQRRVARHRAGRAARSCRQQVATVRVFRPAPTCAEIAARVVFGPRSRAVAARLDLVNDRWLCTAIAFDGQRT